MISSFIFTSKWISSFLCHPLRNFDTRLALRRSVTTATLYDADVTIRFAWCVNHCWGMCVQVRGYAVLTRPNRTKDQAVMLAVRLLWSVIMTQAALGCLPSRGRFFCDLQHLKPFSPGELILLCYVYICEMSSTWKQHCLFYSFSIWLKLRSTKLL
jgi:hypothetical protein